MAILDLANRRPRARHANNVREGRRYDNGDRANEGRGYWPEGDGEGHHRYFWLSDPRVQ